MLPIIGCDGCLQSMAFLQVYLHGRSSFVSDCCFVCRLWLVTCMLSTSGDLRLLQDPCGTMSNNKNNDLINTPMAAICPSPANENASEWPRFSEHTCVACSQGVVHRIKLIRPIAEHHLKDPYMICTCLKAAPNGWIIWFGLLI